MKIELRLSEKMNTVEGEVRGVRKTDRYVEIVGERIKAGEIKEESSQSIKKEYNTVHAVHENVVKHLKAMLFYMT